MISQTQEIGRTSPIAQLEQDRAQEKAVATARMDSLKRAMEWFGLDCLLGSSGTGICPNAILSHWKGRITLGVCILPGYRVGIHFEPSESTLYSRVWYGPEDALHESGEVGLDAKEDWPIVARIWGAALIKLAESSDIASTMRPFALASRVSGTVVGYEPGKKHFRKER